MNYTKPNPPVVAPKKNKKIVSNLIFLLMMTILVIILFLSLGELESIGDTMRQIGQSNNWIYLLIAFFMLIAYYLLWPLSLTVFAKGSKLNAPFIDSYLIGCSEHFYNGITPFATGGQPFQVYSYAKRGCSSAIATGVVIANFITFMFVTNLIAFISLFFWPQFIDGLASISATYQINIFWFRIIAIIGFVINFLTLLFIIGLGTSKTIKKIIIKIVLLLSKIKIFHKFLSKSLPLFEQYTNNAQSAFKEIWKNKKVFLFAFLLKLLTMVCYYTIPFFIMLSVGFTIDSSHFFIIFFGTSFAITTVVFVPTPGGTGGIEYAFAIVIASLSSSLLGQTQGVALIWRFLTYYLLLIISFIASAIFESIYSKKVDSSNKEIIYEAKRSD
jgi:glycosyltransferase 2 family protein